MPVEPYPNLLRALRAAILLGWTFAGCGLVAPLGAQRTFVIDPVRGAPDHPGSRDKPWRTLAEAVASDAWKELRGGDVVLLADGDHGVVEVSGTFDPHVVVAAMAGAKPRLDRLEVRRGAGWTFRGLTVGPAEGAVAERGTLVTAGERGVARDVLFEDCFVRGAASSEGWTVAQWLDLPNGMLAGRQSEGIVFRNCFVANLRNGITLTGPDGVCEGCVVTDFSADALRVTRPGCTLQWNVVKNAYCGGDDGDKNHDDGIQCFVFPKPAAVPQPPADPDAGPDAAAGTQAAAVRDTSSLRDVTVRANLIVNWEDDAQPFRATLQGIGFFDGPMVGFVVEDNVVCVSHWHGVSLYDAQQCRIANNTVFTRWTDVKLRPWVMLGQKKGLARDNVVEGNRAHSIKLGADASVTARDNKTVSAADFRRALLRLRRDIDQRFGEIHPVAGRPRLELRWRP